MQGQYTSVLIKIYRSLLEIGSNLEKIKEQKKADSEISNKWINASYYTGV